MSERIVEVTADPIIEEEVVGEYQGIHMRQLAILPETAWDKSIAIVGVGGIGSITAKMLAKMGVKDLKIIDFDNVELHNTATQEFGIDDLGKQKVKALAEKIKKETGTEVKIVDAKAETLPIADIVILALDSMDERIKLINKAKETFELPEWLIEARMGLEFIRVYTLQPMDTEVLEKYEKTLYPSSEAEALPCSARAVAYNTYFIASVICSQIKKILNHQEAPMEIMGDIDCYGFFKMK